ncbi:MAG: hypothetical protein KDA41_08500, partial [Planctomycetales bacterium]|nr:hypothetical protein [Planctomycetales bacterium]
MPRTLLLIAAACCCGASFVCAPAWAADPPADEAAQFFESKIRPLLASRCFECHGEKKQEYGLRLDSRAAVLAGSDEGAVAVPGKPAESGLIKALEHAGEIKMPPKG